MFLLQALVEFPAKGNGPANNGRCPKRMLTGIHSTASNQQFREKKPRSGATPDKLACIAKPNPRVGYDIFFLNYVVFPSGADQEQIRSDAQNTRSLMPLQNGEEPD